MKLRKKRWKRAVTCHLNFHSREKQWLQSRQSLVLAMPNSSWGPMFTFMRAASLISRYGVAASSTFSLWTNPRVQPILETGKLVKTDTPTKSSSCLCRYWLS